jgi:hypothetical protein
MPLARADLESILRDRKLDRTITTAVSATISADESAVAAVGLATLDAPLAGGLPRGQLSELIGPRSSGRTSLMLQMLSAATARGELVAVVDALDTFDVTSAEAAGIDLERLLWVRGQVVSNPGPCREKNARAIEQAIKALGLILAAGNFGLVVLDVAEAPCDVIRRLPFTTWLRLHRIFDGSQTACVLVGSQSLSRSPAGVTLQLGPCRATFDRRLFHGLTTDARIVRARALKDVCVSFSTFAC